MRLAKEIGRVDWRKMLREMTPQELAEWMAYYRIEPFGKQWQASSAIGAGVCNEIRLVAAGLSKSKPDLLEEDAFLPRFGKADDRPDPIEALEQLRGLPA